MPTSKIVKKVAEKAAKKSDDAHKIVEKLLPKTGDVVADDAARAALRADPKQYKAYLDNLDAAYGDKATRAREMGFGDETWYHGSNVPIDKFSKDWQGLNTGAKSAKKGFFFTSDPNTAEDYAEYANKIGTTKYSGKKRQAFRAINEETDKLVKQYGGYELIPDAELKKLKPLEKNLREITELDEIAQRTNANTMPKHIVEARLKNQNPLVHDYKGEVSRDVSFSDNLDSAVEDGKSGVIFKNTQDNLNNRVEDIAAVVEPNQIRSTNAAFDPRFGDSADILAFNPSANTPSAYVKNALSSIGNNAIAKKIVSGIKGALGSEALKPLRDAAGDTLQPVAAGLDAINAPRQELINKVVPQLDLKRGGDESFRESARSTLDLALPDALDLIPGGRAMKVAGKGADAAKIADKAIDAAKAADKAIDMNRTAKALKPVAGTGATVIVPTIQEIVEKRGPGTVKVIDGPTVKSGVVRLKP